MNIPVGAVKESAVNARIKPHEHRIFVKQTCTDTSCASAGVVVERNGQKFAGFMGKGGVARKHEKN